MLKNLTLRTKLAVVLLLPLAALVAISATSVLDRRDDATAAREDKQVAELLAARVELAHQLQAERIWLSLTGSTAVSQQFEATGSLLRAARADYELRAAAVRSFDPVLRDAIDVAAGLLAGLDAARPTGGRVANQGSIATYDDVLDALGRVGVIAARTGGTAARIDRASMVDLAGLKSGYATLAARATIAINAGLPPAQLEPLRQQVLVLAEQERSFLGTASADARAGYEQQTAAAATATTTLSRFLSTGSDRVVPSDNVAWVNDAVTRLTALRQVEAILTNAVGEAAASEEADAAAAARNAAFVVTAVVLLTLLVASLVAGSIARPITRLTAAADVLADERLPALVERMRRPDAETPTDPVSLPVGSNDEVGRLARALDRIQRVTAAVADEQAALLRKGIGDIFVNLARRNQTLLDRQIEFLDQLEAAEEDPDVLEDLFKLDHLATRMRRNAESLLVLAGAEPPRRRGRPVDLADVVRVAVGEVEHFARLQLVSIDDAAMAGTVAVDVAHLLSELMENATQFSPPESSVDVTGTRTAAGDYRIVVADRGIGMSAEQLAAANDLIAHPPPVGLSISRSLGFTVIGRLAERHALAVRLEASPTGGVRASVELPAAVLDPAGAVRDVPAPSVPGTTSPPGSMAMVAPTPALPDVPDAPPAPAADMPPVPPAWVPPAAPAPPADMPPVPPTWAPPAAPTPPADTPPVRRPVVRPGASATPVPPLVPPPAPAETPAPSLPTVHAAPPAPTPAAAGPEGPAGAPLPRRAAAGAPAAGGLPVRTPAASGMPADSGTDALDPLEGLTQRVPRGEQAAPRPASGAARASQRSPEEVREMLSRYRSGMRKGRTEDDSSPAGPPA